MIRIFCDGCDVVVRHPPGPSRDSREIRAEGCTIRLRVTIGVNGIQGGVLCENCWAAALITMAEQIVADKKERDDRVQA